MSDGAAVFFNVVLRRALCWTYTWKKQHSPQRIERPGMAFEDPRRGLIILNKLL
jgi:hypothetical protein